MNLVHVLLVGAGGFLGSVARYLTVITLDKKMASIFPFGTIAVNILGSFFLGVVVAIAARKTGAPTEAWRLFLATGFCGGFTTFSAFAAENMSLFQQKFPGTALLYIALSVMGGLLAVWAGFVLARNIL